MSSDGHKRWYFPDGDLPPRGEAEPHGHESLLILNPGRRDSKVTLTVYFEEQEPKVITPFSVEGERIKCIRLDEPISGYQIPAGQYALKVDASEPVICQIGRMDVRQPNLAYYTVMGWPQEASSA